MKQKSLRLMGVLTLIGGLSLLFINASPPQIPATRSLLNLKASVDSLKAQYAQDPEFKSRADQIVAIANTYITNPAPNSLYRRNTAGAIVKELSSDGLTEARECEKIVIHSMFAYALTGNMAYKTRAKNEITYLSKSSNYADWAPEAVPKLLSMAEMSTCFGLGYHWTKDLMTLAERKAALSRLAEAGINRTVAKIKYRFATGPDAAKNAATNWNMVVHGGLRIALMLVKDDPLAASYGLDKSAVAVDAAFENTKSGVPAMLSALDNDGAWNESLGYHNYWSSYMSLFLQLYKDQNKVAHPFENDKRMVATSEFLMYMLDPGDFRGFAYSDGSAPQTLSFLAFTGLNKKRSDFITLANRNFKARLRAKRIDDRFFPLELLWYQPSIAGALQNKPLFRGFQNKTGDFYSSRSSWDDSKALFLAAKGGLPSAAHGQMDVGSFLIVKEGVRWIDDIGKESYSLPNFFRGTEESLDNNGRPGNNRWQYFRNNSLSHSVLTFDGRLQNPNGYGRLYASSANHATFDIGELYEQSASRVVRRFFIEGENSVRISDTFQTYDSTKQARWAVIVCNKEIIANGRTVFLQSGTARAALQILAPLDGYFRVESMDATLPANNRRVSGGTAESNNDSCLRISAYFEIRPKGSVEPLSNIQVRFTAE